MIVIYPPGKKHDSCSVEGDRRILKNISRNDNVICENKSISLYCPCYTITYRQQDDAFPFATNVILAPAWRTVLTGNPMSQNWHINYSDCCPKN
jgi:hypothetical protein